MGDGDRVESYAAVRQGAVLAGGCQAGSDA